MRKLTLGSLFDGSGGFPLGGMLCGIEPLWASEIESFPIRVTTKRIPQMKHYGDISAMDGGKILPVDIITFGSPCQDMSVAGKRSGLDGSRSSLFYEAVRIIKEMRCKTNGKYPRYIVWENVPGAFSSNKGEDFRCVLESICGIKAEGLSVPRFDRWQSAGSIVAEDFSLSWRILDAQFWGVPQRRKRIFLVADFAGGSAEKILFESEGLSGYAESVLTTQNYTYTNSGYSVTIHSYFTYVDNVTVTFHFVNGTTSTYTLSQLYSSYRGHVFSGVYKVTATNSYSSWYCYFYTGSKYYYLEPAGGETNAAINIEWNCTMDSETEQNCITEDTLVTMADGTQKAIGTVHAGEYILSYDWATMTLVPNKVTYACCEEENWDTGWYSQRYFRQVFSDGTVIKNCFSHRFYNREERKFVYLEYWRVGDRTYKHDGTNPTLVSVETIYDRVRYARISGELGTNYFANGLLTGDRHCPTDITLPPEETL